MEQHDVVIVGAGLAGITLAFQLKRMHPDVNMVLLERRSEDAPVATHKVGESLSELGAYYLREVLNLKGYLGACHLRKFGFRFFFSPEFAHDITQRVEIGSRIFNPFPSHQVDRGRLENDLVLQLKEEGIPVEMGARVFDIQISGSGHTVFYEKDGAKYQVASRWIVDASGRSSFLKRKLGIAREIDHNINAVWFRLDANIDLDYWSENLRWRSYVDPGLRRLATNHLMGEGYWIWIIPLVEGRTSIGIVADPRYHAFDQINSFDKAMQWMELHEPQAAALFQRHKNQILDFKVMKNFAYGTTQFYGAERWALAGEAGAFLDPFYSPGNDFIALGNTWISDLIIRDLRGEDTRLRTALYDHAHKQLFNGWSDIYRDMYGLFGNTQIMLMKILWDWASYWAVPNVMFANKGYTDMLILRQYSSNNKSIGQRFARLNENMQRLFRAWGAYPAECISGHQLNVFNLECLTRLQSEIGCRYTNEVLMQKIESNINMLEDIAAEIFRKVSNLVHHTPLHLPVDPYTMHLEDGRHAILEMSEDENALPLNISISNDVNKLWLITYKIPENEFAG
jgi:flavin-dependent dehydrogenase